VVITPVFLMKKGKHTIPVLLEGDILGMFPDPFFGSTELEVAKGDRLFLYTDGLYRKGL
jgi:serine phosphatase RsbU (regulator of sigma subunit)